MIVIIDYGMGNLHSVYNALTHLQCDCKISHEKADIVQADGLILPGVGAFEDCMNNLRQKGLIEIIKKEVQKKKPLLGICLGMQVLFEKGYEGKECNGLGILKGTVKKMEDATIKIPHIGWNELERNQKDVLLYDLQKPFVYFVHSYYVQDYQETEVIAYSQYGNLKIPAYIRRDTVFAMQFHPEKSGEDGLSILRKFNEIVKESKMMKRHS